MMHTSSTCLVLQGEPYASVSQMLPLIMQFLSAESRKMQKIKGDTMSMSKLMLGNLLPHLAILANFY